MASIFEIVGGQDASKVQINRDTGVATLKAGIPELGGRDISFQVRETNTATGAAAVITYTQAVAPAALTLNALTITTNEGPIPGLELGQLTASGGTGSYAFSANGGSNELAISADGIVSVAASLGQLANPSAWSYATNTSFTFPVVVNDGVTTATANLTINLIEVVTAPVVIDVSILVPEATTVGTQIAGPSDFGTSAANFDEVVFASGNDAGKFTVDPTTGVVTLAAAVDALVTSAYAPVLRFSKNNNGQSLSSFATLSVAIVGIPALSGGPFSISERATIGEVVGTLGLNNGGDNATTISFNPASSVFSVSDAGVITTTALLDFETLDSYSLTAEASNAAGTSSHTFNIAVEDLPDFAFSNPGSFLIPSDSLEVSGGTVIGTAQIVSTSMLDATATGPSNSEILFTIDSATDCEFKVGGVGVTSFTRQQLGSSLVSFVAVSTGTAANYFNTIDQLSPQFTVTVSDTGASGVPPATTTITPTFTAEFVASDITSDGVIPATELRAISIGDTAAQTQMDIGVIGSNITGGQFELISNPGTAITQWTQADVDAGNITLAQTGAITITNLRPRGSNNFLGAGVSDTVAFSNNIVITQDFSAPSDYIEVSGTSNRTPQFTVTSAMLEATQGGVAPADVDISVTSQINAKFYLLGSAATNFTQANINNGDVLFEFTTASNWTTFYGNQSSLSPTATFSVTTPLSSVTGQTLTITPLPAITYFDIATSARATLATSDLNAIGIGQTNAQLTITASGLGAGMQFYLNGATATSFTQQDIIDGNVEFENTGAAGTVTVTVTDSNGEVSEPATSNVPAALVPITNATYSVSSAFSGTPAISNAIMTDGVFGGSSFVGTNTGSGQFVQASFSAATIVGVRVAGGSGTGWGSISDYLNGRIVETTTDGTTWTNQATIAGVTDSNGYVDILFAAAPSVTAVRISSTATSGLASIVSTSELIPLSS